MRTLVLAIIVFLIIAPASAATFTVTENTDSGDGICDASCTLRDAIIAADLSAGDDIVDFGITGRIELADTLPIWPGAIGGKLTIEGPGVENLTIAAKSVAAEIGIIIGFGAEIKINHLTITEGRMANAGAIDNSGTLTLNDVTIDNGLALAAGAIRNDGTLTLNDVNINNTSSAFNGGAIYNEGTMTLNNSTISDTDTAGSGGAIDNRDTLTLNDTTISNARAGEYAGGITNTGTLTLNNSTIRDCVGNYWGGGISNFGILTLNNSTISGNSVTAHGSGISNGGILTLNNSTVTNNENTGSAIISGTGGAIYNSGPPVALSNSIIAGNFDRDQSEEAYPDVDGSFYSLGHNLIGTTDGSTGFPAAGDQTGTVAAPLDPLLGPLQDNGGPTDTHALLAGSPAIDAGNNALVPAEMTGDQRGFLRIVNGTVDIGAFEFGDGQTAIAIKPGKTPNSINPNSKQKISVAILTTDTFDATQVNWETVLFGPDRATESHGRAHVEDVDGDGDMDLLLHFAVQDTGIACGDTAATLTGATFGGEAISGSDSIVTVKCN